MELTLPGDPWPPRFSRQNGHSPSPRRARLQAPRHGLAVPGGPHPGPAAIWAGPLSVSGAVPCAVGCLVVSLASIHWIPRVPSSQCSNHSLWVVSCPLGGRITLAKTPCSTSLGFGLWRLDGRIRVCLHDPRHLWLPVLAARAGPAPTCPSHGPVRPHVMVSSTFWTSESRHPSRHRGRLPQALP